MVRADLPYTYKVSRKLASGKFKDYWRFRRDGIDTALPGQPGDSEFHARYGELMARCENVAANDTDPERHTFAWLCASYLASQEYLALAERTQDDYRKTIDNRLLPVLGPERFDAIDRKTVKAIRDATAKTHSARTAHKIKQTVSLLYNWAINEELLPDGFVNPAEKIRKLKSKSKSIEVWSEEEIALFLAHTQGVARTAVLLALYTGQRREDLVKMEWSDVQGNMLRVRQNKTDEPLTIPCGPVLKEHLDSIRTQFGGPILRGANKKPMNANQLSSVLNRAVAAVTNMPHRSLHGLRYAAACALEGVGCSVVEISSIVGHRTYQMAMKYASQRKAAQAAVDRRNSA